MFEAGIGRGKVVCVVHGSHSNTGRIGRTLAEQGFEELRCCVKEGDSLPEDLDGIAGAVVFGGPMSANDDRSLDFIAGSWPGSTGCWNPARPFWACAWAPRCWPAAWGRR